MAERLINAEAFEKSVRTDFWEHYTDCHDTDQTDLLELIMDNLAEQPTIEAKPVVHAHWEGSRCSNCKRNLFELFDAGSHLIESFKEEVVCCPYCGAQMDEFAGDINVESKTDHIAGDGKKEGE